MLTLDPAYSPILVYTSNLILCVLAVKNSNPTTSITGVSGNVFKLKMNPCEVETVPPAFPESSSTVVVVIEANVLIVGADVATGRFVGFAVGFSDKALLKGDAVGVLGDGIKLGV